MLCVALVFGSVSASAHGTDIDALLRRSGELRSSLEAEMGKQDVIDTRTLAAGPESDAEVMLAARTEASKENQSVDCVYLEADSSLVRDIYVRPGFVTDLELPCGERPLRITIGDRHRFSVEAFNNSEGDGSWHIYINPAQKNIETNMIVATDRKSYQFRLVAGELFFPIIRWKQIGSDGGMPGSFFIRRTARRETVTEVKDVNGLNFGYSRNSRKHYGWSPVSVFDDRHSNTYFVFEAGRLQSIHPVIFAAEIDGSYSIVPYEKSGDTLVVHRVCAGFELRLGNESVSFRRKYK